MKIAFYSVTVKSKSSPEINKLGTMWIEDGKIKTDGNLDKIIEQIEDNNSTILSGGKLLTPADGDNFLQALIDYYRGTFFWAEIEE